MRILFIIPSYKPAYIYGGTTVVVSELAEELVRQGNEVTVYATTANGAFELDVEVGKETLVNGVKVYYFNRITGDHTHISPALYHRLWKTAKAFDIVHLHSWWSILMIGAAFILKTKRIKPVFSPHGMLSDYSFSIHKAPVKKLIHTFAGKKLLQNSVLHVSTKYEWKESLRINPAWKGAIISNLIRLPDFEPKRNGNAVFTLSFLSRIDPKKGLEILMSALSKVSFPFLIQIAGKADEPYLAQLKSLSLKLELDEKIIWAGWKSGDEKFDFLAASDLFVLTSYSENFAIVVIEALAVGTPVFLSSEVGIADFVSENNLGWISTLDEQSLIIELEEAYKAREERQRIETDAPGLIRNKFNTQSLGQAYLDFYKAIKTGNYSKK